MSRALGRVTRPGAATLLLQSAAVVHADVPEVADDPAAWRDAAVRHAIRTAWDAGDPDAVLALADGYGALLCTEPRTEAGTVTLAPVGIAERRRRGAFATPPGLAAVLARHALPCPRDTVCDPAAGTGALLRAALARLVALGVPAADAVRTLHGVDDDPVAVDLARAALAVDAVRAGACCTPEDLATRVVVGDALLGPTPRLPAAGEGLTWHETFPAVLDDPVAGADPLTGWRGGFGAVVANPPWERLKVTRRDWAAGPPADLRRARAASSKGLREAGRHPLTGAGEINAYLPFIETCWRLLAPDGRAGLVVPAGVAADRSAARLLGALLAAGALDRLHLLDPSAAVFDGVSARVGVAVIALRSGACGDGGAGGNGAGRDAEVAVGLTDAVVDPAADPAAAGRVWRLSVDVPRLVNPNTGTLPLFRTARDAELVTAAHRRFGVLVRRREGGAVLDSPWQVRLVTPLHMTRDARWFSDAPGDGLVPLWEAKHAGLLDHRGGGRSEHRYWVPRGLVEDRLGELTARGWLAGYRNVTTTDAPRTLLPTGLPVAGVGNSLPLIDAPRLPLLLAALASLPVDHLVRQKHAGANLNFFKLEQVALPAPEVYDAPAPWAPETTLAAWVLDRFARAHAWDDDLAGLAAELADLGAPVPSARDRAAALADLDAAHAVLLGWDRADLAHAATGFPALRARELAASGRFGTAERALAAYDRLVGAPEQRPLVCEAR